MLRLAAGAMAAVSSVFMKAPALSMEKETPGETATWRGMAGSIRAWGRHRRKLARILIRGTLPRLELSNSNCRPNPAVAARAA